MNSSCLIFVGLLLLSHLPLLGQTDEQQRWLEQFAADKARQWKQERAIAESLALKLGLPIREELPDGKVIELQRFEDGRPVYYETHNINAARTISTDRVWPGGTGGFSLTGASLDTLGIWDGGAVRTTHQELTGRAIQKDSPSSFSDHATHVGGTMIASGVVANAKGMSYQGRLNAYDWNNDDAEMATAAAAGLRVSNHSYGFITGWRGTTQWWGDLSVNSTEDYYFGFYSTEARDWDNIARNAPYYLIVKSAGNDRNEGPTSQPVTHSHSGIGSFTDTHNVDGAPSGYDCISHAGVSKNILTVGAIDDITGGYTQPSDVVMSSFSSWGPTDDGRIKPDIVANGVGLYSSISTSNNTSYASYDGTSMSSPNVTGSLGLLLNYRRIIAGASAMRSSTLKALVIHTADEAGSNAGPDYVFGWGLMNTLKAAQVMRTDSAQGLNKNIRELTLSQGQTIDISVYSDGTQPLRATICWTDPAGTPPSASLDPPTIMLVNEVDLRVIGGATTYNPWILNPSSPSSAATTGDNIRDNVEQVHLASPAAGSYTVRVTHKGTLSGGSQVVSVIVTGAAFNQSITVTSPNGGETWAIGSTQTMQWSSVGITGNVKLELSRDGGATFPEVLFASTANDGSESWTVTSPASSTARVRVSSVSTPSVADTSNANFLIVQPTLSMTVPNGGETWAIGSNQTITWTSSNVTGNVNIELSRNGGSSYEMLFSNSTNDGTEAWTVAGATTSTARIRITSVSIPTLNDVSDGNFNIVQPTITITAPNGGETWAIGTSRTITWSSSNVTGNVNIELSRNGGSTYETLFSNTSNDGTEAWTVAGATTSTARIRITSVSIPTLNDVSDGNFSIVQPTITVTVPNGGETWAIGTSQTITWTSSNVTGNVKIELSRNNGSNYETLYASTTNDGTEPWVVTGAATVTGLVRISSVDLPSVSDVSNANFSIVQPTITVTAPNGGETWAIGTSQTITWTSSNVTGNVKIELSRNNGSNYETLYASTTNDGTEPWVVTGAATVTGLVRISSVDLPSVSDVSNANFSIVQPTITITAPNGGETWAIGESRTITWASSNVTGNVNIELSRNGGSSYEMLFSNSTNDGTEDWTLAGTATSTARIRITSVSIPTLNDVSDANFNIVQPTITVTAPNGGETWAIGSNQTITWTSSNVTGNVNIELSRNGGSSYEMLFSNSTNDGTEAWTVAGATTSTGRIRITSVSIPTLNDVSDANFNIVQPMITVTVPNGGETWAIGSNQTITWASSNVTGNVNIELSRNGGLAYEMLFSNSTNDGTEAWTVAGTPTSTARIRITSVSIPSLNDVSDANFNIVQPTITVTSPNGGDSWPVGSSQTFAWTFSNISGDVNIELSRDGGSSYETIYSNLTNDGSEDWLVTPPATAQALVRISSVESPSVFDESDGVFRIGMPDTVRADVNRLWNIVSLPMTVEDRRKSTVFPSAISNASTFGGTGYIPRDTLRYGEGYWLKFAAAETLSIYGVYRQIDTINVRLGWNMIGTISFPVPVSSVVQIPSNIVSSPYFGSGTTGYSPASILQPMKGYWVKTNQEGKLVLIGTAVAKGPATK